MTEHKEFTCIACPRGCRLMVSIDDGVASVTGNACPKGATYGAQEAIQPMRTLTTTVTVAGSSRARLPVRSSADLPLSRMLEAMAALDPVVVRPPVRRGDVVVRDLLGLGLDMIATDDLQAVGAAPDGDR